VPTEFNPDVKSALFEKKIRQQQDEKDAKVVEIKSKIEKDMETAMKQFAKLFDKGA